MAQARAQAMTALTTPSSCRAFVCQRALARAGCEATFTSRVTMLVLIINNRLAAFWSQTKEAVAQDRSTVGALWYPQNRYGTAGRLCKNKGKNKFCPQISSKLVSRCV